MVVSGICKIFVCIITYTITWYIKTFLVICACKYCKNKEENTNIVEPIKNLKDIEKIKKYLSDNKRNYLLFSLGINSGLRISDILALDVKDVYYPILQRE